MRDEILFPDTDPEYRVITAKHFNVHQDWCMPIPGFFIIAAGRKVRSIADFTEEEAVEFARILRILRKGMKEKLKVKSIMIFQNEGTEWCGFHLWLFPRYAWMERFGTCSRSMASIRSYAKENMSNERTTGEIKKAVAAMKSYFSKNYA